MFKKINRHSGEKSKWHRHLIELEERGFNEPDNLALQVRIADWLAKTGMKGRAITLYWKTAIKFAQNKKLRQALALTKIVQRLASSGISNKGRGPDLMQARRISKIRNFPKFIS